jgi:ParB family chromosome partitioning protein
MEIVQEYSDHGRSGLNIAGREGLNQLMSDVESKRTDFSALLVYDVSRWGRFQDVDESAYYEYVLKRAGILREVRSLRERGYNVADIARKIGMERMYISGIVHLVEHQEVALIKAVEAGRLPISVAVQIANGKDSKVSEALSQAHETGQLRGTKLAAARRLIAKRIERRQKEGKAEEVRRKVTGNMSVQVYKQRVRERKALIAKAELTKERLLLITSVMRQLIGDENFITLLRAEAVVDMPKQLRARLD